MMSTILGLAVVLAILGAIAWALLQLVYWVTKPRRVPPISPKTAEAGPVMEWIYPDLSTYTEVESLVEKGGEFLQAGDTRRAMGHYTAAEKQVSVEDDPPLAFEIKFGMARAYMDVGQEEKATECLNQAHRIAIDGENELAQFMCESELLNSRLRNGEFETIIREASALRVRAKQLEFGPGEAMSLAQVSGAHLGQGDWKEALDFARSAYAAARICKDESTEAQVHLMIGDVYASAGRLAEAERSLSNALEIAEREGMAAIRADSLSGLGLLDSHRGDHESGSKRLSQALEIYQSLGEPTRVAGTIYSLGEVSARQGEYQKALKTFSDGVDYAREVQNSESEAHGLSRIGSVYEALGRAKEARKYHESSAGLWRGLGDLEAEISEYMFLGELNLFRARGRRAYAYFEMALKLTMSADPPSPLLEAAVRTQLGQLWSASQNAKAAGDEFDRALKIYEQIDHRSGIAKVKSLIGAMYHDNGDLGTARAYYQQALEQMDDATPPEFKKSVLDALRETEKGAD